jgi:hypothetical protein
MMNAFTHMHVRRAATKKLGVPDFVMGLLEDAALAAVGLALLRASRASR